MSTELTVDHVTYSMEKHINEHDNNRLWAIQKQYPKTEAEYHNAHNLALYWYYSKKLGCVYNAAIERKIKSIDLEID
jgi:hypothetical protein